MTNDMWMPVILLAHIGTPFLAGLVVLMMALLAKNGPPEWVDANDAALDLVILSIGAVAPLLLLEHNLRQSFDPALGVYGIALVLVNLLFAGMLVGRKKWKTNRLLTFANVWPDFLLGMVSVAMTSGAFYFAYTRVGGQHA
jgi:hypothetical protein